MMHQTANFVPSNEHRAVPRVPTRIVGYQPAKLRPFEMICLRALLLAVGRPNFREVCNWFERRYSHDKSKA